MSVADLKFVIARGAEAIGAATAKVAARQGAQVCIGDINAEPQTAVEEIKHSGGKTWFIRCDVAEDAQLENLTHEAAAHMGCIDVLNNNAGVIDMAFGTVEQVSLEHFDRKIWD